jgi:lipoprotein-anchoring transpeptidase ErfK/SrfK
VRYNKGNKTLVKFILVSMNIDYSIPGNQAVQQAAEALERGDKRLARYWAQVALSDAPQSEEPWLILAAVSQPQASVEYLKQALLLNPRSERAIRGLRWAQDRLAKQPPEPRLQPKAALSLSVTQPTPTLRQALSGSHTAPVPLRGGNLQPIVKVLPPRKPSAQRMPVLVAILVLICAALTWALWPGNASAALAMFHSESGVSVTDGPSWSLAEIVKPTYTATSTATTVPTATPTPTPTLLPTEIFTPTALPTDSPASVPLAEAPSAPSSGKYVLVSISEQHLYAYQDNILVYSVIASTGMNHSTRAGVFHVLDKIPNAYGATWNIWMPNWLGIYYSGSLENGIHALPILSNGARLWSGYLGTPISFGCVVLDVADAQWLYDWAEVGTTVEIRY